MGNDAIGPFTIDSEGCIDFLTTSNTKIGMMGQRIIKNEGKGNNLVQSITAFILS